MKAMILAAGLGTRLKPWTLEHPKALVPVGGVPMLERVVNRLKEEGFSDLVVNIHHFGEQIISFLEDKDFGVTISISDERDLLLNTGGGLLYAGDKLTEKDTEPFLVHNVDILSTASLADLMFYHKKEGNDVTLLTSGRESSRKLIFDEQGLLKGWHNLSTGAYLPSDYVSASSDREEAFSGIYVMSACVFDSLHEFSASIGRKEFPIMDYFLSRPGIKIGRYYDSHLKLIDIGKPATLEQARQLFE